MNRACTVLLALPCAVLSMLCLVSGAQRVEAMQESQPLVQQTTRQTGTRCPSRTEMDHTLRQASDLLELGRYEDARQTLETFTDMRCEPRAPLLTAAALEAEGMLSQAEQTLETAHKEWPLNTSLATSLAREYMTGKQPDKAAAALDHFRATIETPPQEMQVATVVFLAAHHLSQAQAVAEMAYRQSGSISSLLLLANVMQMEGRYKDVVKTLNGQRQNFAGSALFLITVAESEFDAMLYDAARADLEQAINLDRDSYQAHYLLGNLLVAQNELDKAEQEYRAAIALEPSQPRSYYQLALLLHSKQRDAEEEPLLRQALAADSSYAPAHCELGRLLLDRHQPAEAVSELNLAVKDNSQLEQAYYLLARAYASLGERDKANATAGQFAALRKANRNHPVDTQSNQDHATKALH